MARVACPKTVAAFLDLIALNEGTLEAPHTRDDGYDIIVSGIHGPNTFSDYSAHPFANGRTPIIVAAEPHFIESTASGRYQITLPTWEYISRNHLIGTFSPRQQDMGALILLEECGATALVRAGKVSDAIVAACLTWHSFPSSRTSETNPTINRLLERYQILLATQR